MLWLMQDAGRVEPLIDALGSASSRIHACDDCGFFIEEDEGCTLCHDPRRQQTLICVVEQAADVLKLERSGAYHGLYHVLGGRLSPLEALIRRVKALPKLDEVILAVGADVEGEATASYLGDVLRVENVKVSRLAQGLPAGGGLDHADELTLYQAVSGRRSI
jgi:recombination protein RecR